MPHVDPSDVHVDGVEKPRKTRAKRRAYCREYLEAYHKNARKQLVGWQHDLIHRASLAASGGAAGARVPQHTAIELQLLRRLSPGQLSDFEDKALEDAWIELAEYYRKAKKRKLDTSDYERGASFVAQEMHHRGMEFDRGGMIGKSALALGKLKERCRMLPDEIVLAPAAALVKEDEGLGLRYDQQLGDDGMVSDALLSVGVTCKSAVPADLEQLGPAMHLYDLVLRRPGVAPSVDDASPLYLCDDRDVISKAIKEKRCIWYVAAEPDVKDIYGDIITRDEIEDQAHRFMLGPRRVFMEHGDLQGLNTSHAWPRELTGKAYTVESGLAFCDSNDFFGVETPRPIRAGSWIVCNYYPDAQLWNFLSNTPHGISWRGYAAKEKR